MSTPSKDTKEKCFRYTSIAWSKLAGARERPKRLHLVPSENSLYKCPVESCEHEGFESQRGVRKHVHSRHPWFYYFDKKPTMSLATSNVIAEKQPSAPMKGTRSTDTSLIPSFPMDSPAGHEFVAWLTNTAWGGKNARQAHQTARSLKFL